MENVETSGRSVVQYNYLHRKLERVARTAALWAIFLALPVSFILAFVVGRFFGAHSWIREHLLLLWLAFWIGGGVVAGLVEAIVSPSRAEIDHLIRHHLRSFPGATFVRNPLDPEGP